MSESKALNIVRELAPTAHEFDEKLHLHGGKINEYTPLISENALPQVISELEALCVPTSPERATYWGKILAGSYPNLKVQDPKTYAIAISSVFAEAPDDLCRRAVDQITRNHEFPPSRAIVHKTLARLRGERMSKIGVAKAMQREHERRRQEAQEAERRAEERRKWKEKHGDNSPLEVDGFKAKQMPKEKA